MVSSVMGGSQGMAEANFSSGTQSGPSCPSPCRKAHSKRCASLTGRASIWGWTWPAAVQQLVDARRVLMPERELIATRRGSTERSHVSAPSTPGVAPRSVVASRSDEQCIAGT